MNIDADDLKLLVQISNYRHFLRAPRSPLVAKEFGSLQNTMRRIKVATAELKVLEERWVNRGLEKAGLGKAVDPETKPLPVYDTGERENFCAPDPVLMAECAARKPIAAVVRVVPTPEIHK